MPELVGYRNGEWPPMNQILPDPNDRGTLLGDQVLDVERTFGGKGFRLEEHVERLYKSLKYVRIDLELSPAEMLLLTEEGIRRNLERAPGTDFIITQLITRGSGGTRAWMAGPPNVYIKYAPVANEWLARYFREGLHAVVTKTRSYHPLALDPKIKHLSRMNMALAEIEANDLDPGAWPILTDDAGNLTEGSGYNVFIVSGGVLRTPDDRAILAGVSRQTVLDLAAEIGVPTKEEDLQPYDIHTADEAFFASTPWSILPVTHVDRQPIGDGRPGEVTGRLLDAWTELVGVDVRAEAEQLAAGG